MSRQDGMAAINLEMPDRVPRTEYSVTQHWELVEKVTGIPVGVGSPAETKTKAAQAFMKAWHFDFTWGTLIGGGVFGAMRTYMGHAVYAAGGVDYNRRISCPFKDTTEVLRFDPMAVYGLRDRQKLIDDFDRHYDALEKANPDMVNTTGVYVTCVSGLIDIFGWEMLLVAAGEDPEEFGAMTNRYASWVMQYFKALAASRAPVVMVHDDIVWTGGAVFAPAWYRKFVFPNYIKYMEPLLEAGKKIMFTSDGNYTEFIDDIAAAGVHGFVMEPTTDMAYVAEKYGKTHAFIGNADTRILLSGTRQEIYDEVKRCMDIGKPCPGFFMAVGNHIPANTPVENALYYNEVYESMSRR